MKEAGHRRQCHCDGGSRFRAGTPWPSCSSQQRAQELGQISLGIGLRWVAHGGRNGGVGECLSRGVGRGMWRRHGGGIRGGRGRERGLIASRGGSGHWITWSSKENYLRFYNTIVTYLLILSLFHKQNSFYLFFHTNCDQDTY